MRVQRRIEMRAVPPKTETMKISDVRSHLNTLVNRVYRKETRVVVEKSGIPVAAIVSLEDLERLERERAARFAVIDEFRKAFAGVPDEELEREAARAVEEVRAEMRAEREHATAKR